MRHSDIREFLFLRLEWSSEFTVLEYPAISNSDDSARDTARSGHDIFQECIMQAPRARSERRIQRQ
eukprot:2446266-Pyramimonas_sp.AAC.1